MVAINSISFCHKLEMSPRSTFSDNIHLKNCKNKKVCYVGSRILHSRKHLSIAFKNNIPKYPNAFKISLTSWRATENESFIFMKTGKGNCLLAFQGNCLYFLQHYNYFLLSKTDKNYLPLREIWSWNSLF